MATPQTPLGLFGTDALIGEEDLAIRDTVRKFVEGRIKPQLAEWYESGAIPARELARELGSLGVLGMHLEGYGCAGTSATAYGLACLELEAGDSGLRSLVSCRDPWRCSRSGSSAPRSRSRSGCPGWPPVRRSAASG